MLHSEQFEFNLLMFAVSNELCILHVARLLKRTVQMPQKTQKTFLAVIRRLVGVCGFSCLGKQSFNVVCARSNLLFLLHIHVHVLSVLLH